jgi:hypothetical protein
MIEENGALQKTIFLSRSLILGKGSQSTPFSVEAAGLSLPVILFITWTNKPVEIIALTILLPVETAVLSFNIIPGIANNAADKN